MIVRPLQVADIPGVLDLYRQMIAEHATKGPVRYPQPTDATPGEMGDYLYHSVTSGSPDLLPVVATADDGHRLPDGTPIGGTAIGFALASIYLRPIGHPKRVGYVEVLYVNPSHRNGRGPRAVAVQILKALGEEAYRRYPPAEDGTPGLVIEGGYVPGTHGEKLWPGLGLRPYVVLCAFVDDQGNPLHRDQLFRRRKRKKG